VRRRSWASRLGLLSSEAAGGCGQLIPSTDIVVVAEIMGTSASQ
jgi:hypothetical protein